MVGDTDINSDKTQKNKKDHHKRKRIGLFLGTQNLWPFQDLFPRSDPDTPALAFASGGLTCAVLRKPESPEDASQHPAEMVKEETHNGFNVNVVQQNT